MGFFRAEAAMPEAGPEVSKQIDSAEALLRAAEQDERVARVLQNFETQLEDLPHQVQIGGGMTLADWNLVREFGTFAMSALAEFGYESNQEVFDAHFQSMLSK